MADVGKSEQQSEGDEGSNEDFATELKADLCEKKRIAQARCNEYYRQNPHFTTPEALARLT
ncbi:hypothetical protein FJ936_09075 [Mesorhizobium sp. B2-4-13]|uniref:hypothetical protein n=1 Tax=Mesorhizobium sp. B2-4-13 TaxID=2589936 RepID=UPI001153F758|nr:hypothetical protein [Mesorhizobium sp. B2-4-13]TPK85680.1 hypothetical protein FJ936_09075 [Mesorhizobium sp. B2-4-13]